MEKRIRLIGVAICFAATISLSSTAAPALEATDKIAITARCIDQMKAYRQAIGFIADRLEKSPPALTYMRENGSALTLHNRIHRTMQYERRVLEAGMLARERTCAKALVS